MLEIKARKFEVGDNAQLGLYMTAVDKLLRHEDDKPSLGLLLVKSKNEILVEYALGDMNKPIGIAAWETQLTQSLPDNLQVSLPTIDELEAELKKSSDSDGVTIAFPRIFTPRLDGDNRLTTLKQKKYGSFVSTSKKGQRFNKVLRPVSFIYDKPAKRGFFNIWRKIHE